MKKMIFLRHPTDGNLIWEKSDTPFLLPAFSVLFSCHKVSLEGEKFFIIKVWQIRAGLSDQEQGEIKTFNIQWSNTMSIYDESVHFVCTVDWKHSFWVIKKIFCVIKHE